MRPLTRRGGIGGPEVSKSICEAANGRTSPRAIVAAIRARWSPIWKASPRVKRRGCLAGCLASIPGRPGVMDEFDDRFEPLTESERAAAQAGDDAPKDDGECVMPVPSDAPPVPDAHPGLGKPSCRWPYRDAAGRLLFEVRRFDPVGKRKIFLPLSLWRDAS